jgi:GT2 family glycosyltransferase
MTLAIITAHAGAESLGDAIASWGFDRNHTHVADGREGMLEAYEACWRAYTGDVLAFMHDDLILHDPKWSERVLREFDDPTVGLVGFGGALGHGSDDLYKTPYDYRQLGRSRYRSNTTDAELHGERFAGECDVAVLDGFALIVRREILERWGGWPLGTPVGYSLYDYSLCCEAHRQGYRIRLVGVNCWHMGGQTAVKLKMANGQGAAHEEAHRWVYDNYRDVLPWKTE